MLAITLIAAIHLLGVMGVHFPVLLTGDVTISSGILNAVVPVLVVAALSFCAYVVRQIAKSNESQAKVAQVVEDHDKRMNTQDRRLDRLERYFWRPSPGPSAPASVDTVVTTVSAPAVAAASAAPAASPDITGNAAGNDAPDITVK